MNEKNSSELGAFLAGFVIGGLVGAATALILAPQSGSDTRAKISDKSYELRDAGSERIQQTRESATHIAHEYQARSQDAVASAQDQARIVLDRGKKQANETSDQVEEQLTDLAQTASDMADDVADIAAEDAPAT